MLLFLIAFTFAACQSIKKQIEIAGQREEKFKVDMKSPKIQVGSVEMQLDRALFGLKKTTVNVSYSPVEDAVCLEFKRNTITNYQFFNKANRTAYLNALEKYLEDYDNRKLADKKTTKQQYGSDEGYLIWKVTKVSNQFSSNVDFSFGYKFKEKSPFFTITQGEAVFEEDFSVRNSEKYTTNGEFQLFFTRAQATELAAFFDQQFIRSMNTQERQSFDPNINYESY